MAPSHALHMGKPGAHYHRAPALTLAQDTKASHRHRMDGGHMSHILCLSASGANLSLSEKRAEAEGKGRHKKGLRCT